MFEEWDPEPAAVTGDATYTALFATNVNAYTVVWKDDDGTALATNAVAYGETPVYPGETAPAKPDDGTYRYAFAGWHPAPEPVTADAAYEAVFSREEILFAAAVGDARFESLAAAVAAAEDGDTVRLLRDLEEAGTVVAKDIALDLGGFAWSLTETPFVAEGRVSVSNGAVAAAVANAFTARGTNAVLSFAGEVSLVGGAGLLHACEGGLLAVAGGVFEADEPIAHDDASSAAVSGGRFSSPVPAGCCAEGYAPVAEADAEGFYTVERVCRISFDPAGGTVEPASRVVAAGAAAGDLPVPVRNAWTFLGWFTEAGEKADASFAATTDVTLVAHWTQTSKTVVFDANGGTVTPASRKVDYGQAVGALPTPVRANFIFAGWYTAKSGGSKISAATGITANRTFHAHWTATWKIVFNPNGGTCGTGTRLVARGAAIGKLPTAKRSGCVLAGWYTAKTGGSKVSATTKVTASRTLHARWAAAWKVAFDANGGTCDTKGRWVKKGAAVGTLPAATRSGCKFLGWYTAKTGGSKIAATTKIAANRTFYARWQSTAPQDALQAAPSSAAQKVFAVDDCGVFPLGTCELAISPEPPAVEELGDRTESAESAPPLAATFRVPAGAAARQLWSAGRGILAEGAVSSSTIVLELPDLGIWHWLRFFDADGATLSSTWLFPSE